MSNLSHNRLLFKSKLDELERHLSELTNYSIIEATQPIRILLIDSPNLLDILNRETRYPVLFRVNGEKWRDEDVAGISLFRWREITPLYPDMVLDLKKQAFLDYQCGIINGKTIRIIDVIKFYAYVRGGIHLDKNDPDFEHLKVAFDLIKVNNISSLDHTMRGITQTVFNTLNACKEYLLNGSSTE